MVQEGREKIRTRIAGGRGMNNSSDASCFRCFMEHEKKPVDSEQKRFACSTHRDTQGWYVFMIHNVTSLSYLRGAMMMHAGRGKRRSDGKERCFVTILTWFNGTEWSDPNTVKTLDLTDPLPCSVSPGIGSRCWWWRQRWRWGGGDWCTIIWGCEDRCTNKLNLLNVPDTLFRWTALTVHSFTIHCFQDVRRWWPVDQDFRWCTSHVNSFVSLVVVSSTTCNVPVPNILTVNVFSTPCGFGLQGLIRRKVCPQGMDGTC